MRILLATDGSVHSQKAVEMATTLGNITEIKIVCVVEAALPINLDIYGGNYIPQTAELEKVARENARTILENAREAIVRKLSDEEAVVVIEILFGSPESQIVETAEKMNADLIIVGSHGYNTWERLLLGSVSDSVVHHAPCSVLVVRGSRKLNL
jgi:nucleotide-binding universal stress UspA family protein